MIYGHRNDPEGFHRCLREFDRRVPDLRAALRPDDLLVLTRTTAATRRRPRPTTRASTRCSSRTPRAASRARRPPRRRARRRRRDRPPLARRGGPPHDAELPGARSRSGPDARRRRHRAQARRRRRTRRSEIRFLIDGAVRGRPSRTSRSRAWLMAVVLRGLADDEIDALCAAMVESGDVVDLSSLGRPAVDKHSTGGVGDKVTIALAPLVAACGVPCAKMSGRGLGHTGGTLDKLEAIPGFRIDAGRGRVRRARSRAGRLRRRRADGPTSCPPTASLYALRDVTGTVPAPGLIATSRDVEEARRRAPTRSCSTSRSATARSCPRSRRRASWRASCAGLGARAGRPRVVRADRAWTCRSGVRSATRSRSPRRSTCCAARGRRLLDGLVRGSAAALLELGGYADAASRALAGATRRSRPVPAVARGRTLGRGAGRRRAVGRRRRGTCWSGRPSSRPSRPRRPASWTASAPSPWGSPRCASAPAARARTIRSTRRSASSSRSIPATRSRPASRSPGCTRATPLPPRRAATEVLAAARIVDGPVDVPGVVIETIGG